MISLYPFHIHISFPYSHILPYPYISHIHVSIFLLVPPVALPLVFFFIFSFLWRGGGVCFSCGFLVSVLWMFFSLFLVPLLVSFFIPFFGPFLVSSFVPFFAPLRLSFRPSARFLVSFLGSLSVPPFCSFLRLGVSGGRFVGRAVFVSSSGAGRAFISLSCFGAVGAMCRHVVSLMGAVRKMAWQGVCAGRGACRSARRWAGRDGRLMAKWVLCVARSLFSYRLFGYGGEAIDAPFLSARLGGLSGGGGTGIMDGCAGGWR